MQRIRFVWLAVPVRWVCLPAAEWLAACGEVSVTGALWELKYTYTCRSFKLNMRKPCELYFLLTNDDYRLKTI